MVHFTDTVVTLKDLSSGKPFREFDHSRSGSTSTVTVRMPFDTEYGITLKTMDWGRRRMEVTIDGTRVADLIFQGGPGFQETLERFMDSDKRFKFVKATNAAVADPTNPSNGDIVVKVWREYVQLLQPVYTRCGLRSTGFHEGVLRGATKRMEPAVPTCGGSFGPSSPVGATVEGGATLSFTGGQTQSMNASCSYLAQAAAEEKGATVEGSSSGQQFGTTTWAGDLGEPSVFVFKLRSPAAPAVPVVTTCTAIYCHQCGFAAGSCARFCAACGTKLAIVTISP